MKKHLFLLTLFLIIGITISGCSTNEQKVYPYEFESLKVTYELTGDVTGQNIFYVKGDRHKREMDTVMKIGDFEKKNHTVFIDDKDMFYVIDLNEKTGVIMENPAYQKVQSLPQDKKIEYLNLISLGISPDAEDQEAKEKALEVKEEKEILGKKCQVYVFADGEICLWNTVPLWFSLDQQGVKYVSEAKTLEENIEIPDETFAIPEDIKIEDLRESAGTNTQSQ